MRLKVGFKKKLITEADEMIFPAYSILSSFTDTVLFCSTHLQCTS